MELHEPVQIQNTHSIYFDKKGECEENAKYEPALFIPKITTQGIREVVGTDIQTGILKFFWWKIYFAHIGFILLMFHPFLTKFSLILQILKTEA